MKRIFIILINFLVLIFNLKGQLQVQGGLSADQLVGILVGGGVQISNANYSGPSGCIGAFSNGQTTNLGLSNGIVLSTGGINGVANPPSYHLSNDMGGAGDPTLQQMAGNTSYDAVVLTFNFVPLSTPVTFRYVFGSEEYPEYVCSSFNDVFGFFVTGPNPNGGNYNNTNVALIPNTNIPVMINSVNPGVPGSYGSSGNCVSLSYSQYYVNNTGNTICFDGFTTVLTATIDVIPCQTYSIKIAISDIGDGIYDSGVFLEANSFISHAITPSVYFTSQVFNQYGIEGCSNAIVTFSIPQPVNQPVTVNYTIGGTATNGVDYAPIPSQVTIPAGQTQTSISINFANDGIEEGVETVILIVQTSPCSQDTIVIEVHDNNPLNVSISPSNISICDGQQPVLFSANATGGFGTYSYNWSDGLGNQPDITISPQVGSYYYTVTVTDQCQQTATASVSVTVNLTPTANFTVESPICAGQPSTVTYTGSGASIFNWNLSGATVLSGNPSSGQPFQITWYQEGTYPIILQTQTNAGCASQPETLYVLVYGAGTPNCCQFPTPYAGPDQTVCGLTYQLQADPPDNPAYVGTWSLINGPGQATFSNPTFYASAVTVSQPGTYVFEWKEINGPCDSSDQVVITFIQQPFANAGPDAAVCGLTYTLNATYSTPTSSGYWSGTGVINPNNPTTQVTVPTYGEYVYVWTEVNGICSSKDTVIVNFLEVPQPNAGNDTTVCGHKAILNAITNFPGYWSGPQGVIYVNGFDTSYTPIYFPSFPGTSYSAYFVWHANNGACWGTDTVKITFLKLPHAEAGQQISVCGTFTQLNADTIGSGAIYAYWTSLPPGPIINQEGNIPFNATVDISHLIPSIYHHSVAEFYFYWHVSNGICQNYDSVKVTFYEIPEAFAGNDTSICGKSYTMNAAWSIQNRTGQWYQISGPGTSNFSNPNSPNSLVTVTQYGTYTYVWKEMNGGMPQCYDTDTVEITFLVVPMPDAGTDFSVCGMFAQISATPSTAGGSWVAPPGVAFYNCETMEYCSNCDTLPTTCIRYSSENDTITMYWVEFNGVCYGYDSVNIYFGKVVPAVILTNPLDTFVCGNKYSNLSAQAPDVGYGYWVDDVMNTTFIPSPTMNVGVVAEIGSGDSYYGKHCFRWITVNGSCRDTSEAHCVWFIKQPQANAGGNYWPGLFGMGSDIKTDTACGCEYKLNAVYSIAGSTGTWYTLDPANVVFLNGEYESEIGYVTHVADDSVYVLGSGCYTVFNMNAPYKEFVWQERNDKCVDSDTLRIYFAPRPSGNFSVTMPACRYDSSKIIANTWMLPNHEDYGIEYFWWDLGGGILVMASDGELNKSDTIYVRWLSGDEHVVKLITENRWGCKSGVVSKLVREPDKFKPQSEVKDATCSRCNGVITLSTSYIDNDGTEHPNYFVFEWLIDNSDSLEKVNLCAGSYEVVVIGESISPDASPGTKCRDTIEVVVRDTGHTIALFDTTSIEQWQAAEYTVRIINTSINGYKYSWRIYTEEGKLIYAGTSKDLEYTFKEAGCYRVVLISKSKEGCLDTFEYKYICVDWSPVLEVPNVFTPNGDGINDEFKVNGKSIVEFDCKIYNRWGRKVYEWNDITKGWNGKIDGDKREASPGTYYYIIKAKDKKGKNYELNGFFYLLKEKK